MPDPRVDVTVDVDARAFTVGVREFSPALIRAIQLKLARVTGPRWARMARRLTRRDTGRLRRTVYHEVTGRGPIVLRVGYDVRELMREQAGAVKRPTPYAGWVEYGTGKRPGDHVLTRVRSRQDRRIRQDVQEAVSEAGRDVFGAGKG